MKVKPVDFDDDTLDSLERTFMIMLDHEQNVGYEFTNNDYNCARSQGEMSNDAYALEQALRIKDDVDKIVAHHKNVQDLMKRVIAQAKVANELHANIVEKNNGN